MLAETVSLSWTAAAGLPPFSLGLRARGPPVPAQTATTGSSATIRHRRGAQRFSFAHRIVRQVRLRDPQFLHEAGAPCPAAPSRRTRTPRRPAVRIHAQCCACAKASRAAGLHGAHRPAAHGHRPGLQARGPGPDRAMTWDYAPHSSAGSTLLSDPGPVPRVDFEVQPQPVARWRSCRRRPPPGFRRWASNT